MGGYQAYTGNPWPNYTQWVDNTWGSGQEGGCVGWPGYFAFGPATNLVFGTNPAYALDDFLSVFPKFFGTPTQVSGAATTLGSQTVNVPSVNGLLIGQFLQAAGLPKGTVITGLLADAVTVSTTATASGAVTLQVYEAPPIPVVVIQLYLNLAAASLVQARWQDAWTLAMGWFIAHYCTLYARSDASQVQTALQSITHGEVPQGAVGQATYTLSAPPPGGVLQTLSNNGLFLTPGVGYTLNGTTITLANPQPGDNLYATWIAEQMTVNTAIPYSGAQIAAQGLAGGIQTSKSAGDVSVSYQPLASIEDWGQWNLTSYGQQFASMARVIGAGPMLVW